MSIFAKNLILALIWAALTADFSLFSLVTRFAARFALLFMLYSALVWSVIWLIRHHFATT